MRHHYSQRFDTTWILASICCLLSAEGGFPPAISASDVPRITQRARSLQPGEVVQLTLTSPEPLESAQAEAFGRKFPFYSEGNPKIWRALIGIDLETKPGANTVNVRAVTLLKTSILLKHPLSVRSKVFPTRHLSVDEKFVNPPPEVSDRIKRESQHVSEIVSTVTPVRLWEGAFDPPVPGPPISSFGKRSILNGQARSPHAGTDFEGSTGTPIKAPNRGRVVLAAELYYSGNTVILDHGLGLYSYFGHLSRIEVTEGEVVPAGRVVGEVGATGRVTGPHLHWSVRLSETRVDPLSLMAVLAQPHP